MFILVWALLVVTALDISYGNPCENGPSGRFCHKDLSGWYECKEEEGEMVQREHKCSKGTRCVCSDLACNSALQDPCGGFVDPPIFPPVFTLYYNEKVISCDAKGCNTSYINGDDFQNVNEGKMRTDTTAIFYASGFILRKSGSPGYDTFYVRWDKTTCAKGSTDTLNRFRVPPTFTYAGQFVKDGVTYYKWVKTGGEGSISTEETWLTKKNEKGDDIPWSYDRESADSKAETNMTISVEFPAFTEEVDEEKFVLPPFCEALSD